MKHTKFNILCFFFANAFLAFALLAPAGHSSSYAQGKFPTEKTIRILTPYETGSLVDVVTRLLAEELRAEFGQDVIVENRSGGMGMIAMNALLSAQADGYTLLTDTPASAINPSLYKAKYDPKRDIAPIAQLMSTPFVLLTNRSLGIRSAKELVAHAKESPDPLNVAVAGTSTRLVTELFASQNAIRFNPVFYRGAASALDGTIKNETQLIMIDVGNALPFIQDGRLDGLMVTSDKRISSIKNVPTYKESGFAGFNVTTWFGLFARAEVPHDIQERLNLAVRKAMNSPKLKTFIKQREASSSSLSRAEFKSYFDSDVDKWAQLIRHSGVKLQ